MSHPIRHRARVLGLAALTLCLAAGALTRAPADPLPADWRERFRRPAEIPFPRDHPHTPAKAALGQRLFTDTALSANRTRACVSCHLPERAWGDGRARAIGDAGNTMALRSPTLLAVAWGDRLGWDGKFRDIEAVTFAAVNGHANMNLPTEEAIARLAADPAYAPLARDAFGDPGLTRPRVEQALATYERTIVPGPAPFDRYVAGDPGAIPPAARRGFALFNGRGGCATCHAGWAFTDGSFADIGSATGDDLGRGRLFPSSAKLRYAFKVPTLRDVARRAPYMHDGAVRTLPAVIELYDRGGIDRPSRAPGIRPLGLTPAEKSDLLAFLATLTSDPPAASP